MVNWHISDNLRLEFTYGYGELDRFGLTGGTQFSRPYSERTRLTGGTPGKETCSYSITLDTHG
jgi:hypothetical protein